MDETKRLSNRMMELELQLMHLQKDFDSLNEVVLSQNRRLDDVIVGLKRLENKFSAAGEQADDRDPVDEKPPHY